MFTPNQNLNFGGKNASNPPTLAFILIIFGALIAFEIFNYSTTEHALMDLLGDLRFIGIHWATILSLAFCGIDFAGIARLLTPEQGVDEPKEVWYLFGAWLLAATMNALLTWWGVSMAVVNHSLQSTSVVDPETLIKIVPVFVAIMVWVIRILIIGMLSLAVDRFLHGGVSQRTAQQKPATTTVRRLSGQQNNSVLPPGSTNKQIIPGNSPRQAGVRAASGRTSTAGIRSIGFASAEDEVDAGDAPSNSRVEPTYHSLGGQRSTSDRFRRS